MFVDLTWVLIAVALIVLLRLAAMLFECLYSSSTKSRIQNYKLQEKHEQLIWRITSLFMGWERAGDKDDPLTWWNTLIGCSEDACSSLVLTTDWLPLHGFRENRQNPTVVRLALMLPFQLKKVRHWGQTLKFPPSHVSHHSNNRIIIPIGLRRSFALLWITRRSLPNR